MGKIRKKRDGLFMHLFKIIGNVLLSFLVLTADKWWKGIFRWYIWISSIILSVWHCVLQERHEKDEWSRQQNCNSKLQEIHWKTEKFYRSK